MAHKKTLTTRLGYVIVYVPDVRAAVRFYERAFGLSPRFVHESGKYAELETGTTALAFADETFTVTRGTFQPNRLEKKAAGIEVALVVPDVKRAYEAALASGATAAFAPKEEPWGQTVSYVRDLNGVLVELCSAVA